MLQKFQKFPKILRMLVYLRNEEKNPEITKI